VVNQIRINQLVARNKALIKLLNKTQISLIKKCKSDSKYYSDLLRKLILEGCIRMMEPVTIVYCLQRDKAQVSELLPQCKREYEDFLKQQLDEDVTIDIRLAEKSFLQQRDIPDLGNIDIAAIEASHETSIKINHMEDDKAW